jgi:hypothetical protein
MKWLNGKSHLVSFALAECETETVSGRVSLIVSRGAISIDINAPA